MFELSGKVEFLYCMNCGRNDTVNTTINGNKFHVYYQSFHSRAKAVECHGPFAYSEPPTKTEEMHTLFANLDENFDEEMNDGALEAFGMTRIQAEETDIEQLATLTMNDLHFQPLHEILIDNILHGDVSLYEQ